VNKFDLERGSGRGMSELPEGWAWATLEEVCSKIQDGTHFSPKQQSNSGDYKYITAKNIKVQGIALKEITYVSEEVHREIYNRCNPEKGDVLYIKDGATTGIATVNTLDEEFSLLSSVALLKPIRDCLDSRFLKWYLNSPDGYKAMTDQMTGSAITRIILQRIRTSPIPLAPLNEQRRIVAKLEKLLSRVDAAQARLATISRTLKRFRQSVLSAACSGRLTIDWRNANQDVKAVHLCSEEAEAGGENELPDTWAVVRVGKVISGLKYGTSQKCSYEKRGVPVLRIPNIGDGVIETKDLKYAQLQPSEFEQLKLSEGDILLIRSNGSVSLVGI
jgi:type I restriction enzyme S subunit